jgi:hypothetical protein
MKMAMYRIYAPVPDQWGGTEVVRIGHTFGDIKKALERARKVSEKYGIAEVKDDARSIYDRLLAVFRDGHQIGS